MKTLYVKRSIASVFEKCNVQLTACITILFFCVIAHVSPASAQEVLFDFDNAPRYTSLPIDQTVSGITAHFSATGQGFSIQAANTLGFTPQGFAGNVIYPNSINLADILIRFDQTLTHFSIMYSCQELGCDDAATMRVTAYRHGDSVGTNTKIAGVPGTWPVDTLACSFPQGFDSVVVHYDKRPPTCQDFGVVFLADNMRVVPIVNGVSEGEFPTKFSLRQNYPNPFNPTTNFVFQIADRGFVTLKIYDILGHEVAALVNEVKPPGLYNISWDATCFASGMYFYRLDATSAADPTKHFSQTRETVLVK